LGHRADPLHRHRRPVGPPVPVAAGRRTPMKKVRTIENWILSIGALFAAALWIFPLYWAFITSIRTEERVVSDAAGLAPDEFNLAAYIDVIWNTRLLSWYLNSIGTALIITLVVIVSGMMCA